MSDQDEREESYGKPELTPLGDARGELPEQDLNAVTGGGGDAPTSDGCMDGYDNVAKCIAGFA